jgi:YD repeat-containing protein
VLGQTIEIGAWSVAQTYGYDPFNRLASAAEAGGWSQGFGYDEYGNMWVDSVSGLTLSPNTPTSSSWFPSNNRLENPSVSTDFDYDEAGNQINSGGSSVELTYDAENRMVQFEVTGSNIRELYDYDGEGRRVRHRHQVYSGGNWGTTQQTLYVYDAFGQLAAEYGDPSTDADCFTCYLTTDLLGSTRLITNHLGEPVARYDYLPFGQEIPDGINDRDDIMCGSVSCYGQFDAIRHNL